MKRHRFLAILGMAAFAVASPLPFGQLSQSAEPSAGAVTADAAFPPIGSRWKVRVTDSSGIIKELEITAAAVDFNGRQAYGLVGPAITSARDPVTFNQIGTLGGGQAVLTETPDNGAYSWPLYTGKTWNVSYNRISAKLGRGFNIPRRVTVTAYENVAVPAGTFKAFRLDYTEGVPPFELGTYWYAPAVKLVVKSVWERTGRNILGAAAPETTELISLPK